MVRTICCFVLLVASALVTADDSISNAFLNGNKLMEACTSDDARLVAMCRGYLKGISDEVEALNSVDVIPKTKTFCLPIGVNDVQLQEIVVKYYTDHPEVRHFAAALNIHGLLSNTFPCVPTSPQ